MKNISLFDKIIRLILGFILLIFLFKSFLVLIAILLIITALAEFCPLYKLAGISKPKTEKNSPDSTDNKGNIDLLKK